MHLEDVFSNNIQKCSKSFGQKNLFGRLWLLSSEIRKPQAAMRHLMCDIGCLGIIGEISGENDAQWCELMRNVTIWGRTIETFWNILKHIETNFPFLIFVQYISICSLNVKDFYILLLWFNSNQVKSILCLIHPGLSVYRLCLSVVHLFPFLGISQVFLSMRGPEAKAPMIDWIHLETAACGIKSAAWHLADHVGKLTICSKCSPIITNLQQMFTNQIRRGDAGCTCPRRSRKYMEVSHIFPHIPIYSRVFPIIFIYSMIFPYTSIYYGVGFWTISAELGNLLLISFNILYINSFNIF